MIGNSDSGRRRNIRTRNFDAIVASYIRDHRASARAGMRAFEIQRSLTATIRNAALCLLPGGKRHPHQRRIPQAVLNEAEYRLQRARNTLKHAPDFAALHRLVESEIGSIHGIGMLTVYDVAHRVGAFLGKTPALVYLHAGTQAGAAALGFTRETIDPAALPATFARLSAAEIEDCLCIYKDQLRGGEIRTGLLQRSGRCGNIRSSRLRRC
jgi:hypothetical protein